MCESGLARGATPNAAGHRRGSLYRVKQPRTVSVLYIYSCHIVAYSSSNTPVAKHRPHSTAITPDRISESRARAQWRQDDVNCGIFCQASRFVTRQTDLPIWALGYVVRFLTRGGVWQPLRLENTALRWRNSSSSRERPQLLFRAAL